MKTKTMPKELYAEVAGYLAKDAILVACEMISRECYEATVVNRITDDIITINASNYDGDNGKWRLTTHTRSLDLMHKALSDSIFDDVDEDLTA